MPLACRQSARGVELEREYELLKVREEAHGGCLFARKVSASCDLSCFASSEFRSFQC